MTDDGRNKGPRGAADFGCGFSVTYVPKSRGAPERPTSRFRRFSNNFRMLMRCADFSAMSEGVLLCLPHEPGLNGSGQASSAMLGYM